MGSSSCSWPDKKLSKKLVKELVQGRDLATQLQNLLLQRPFGENGSISVLAAAELTAKILSSFTDTLSVLSSKTSITITTTSTSFYPDHDRNNVVRSQIDVPDEPSSHVDQSQCGDRGSEDSGEISTKRSTASKDRRGCYKRRKSSQSWTKVTSKIEDGQAWRKYGQKDILHAQYPRAYFRCTRKYDQGCRATKQVQQIQDNPKLYQTTYIGHHTCKNILKAPQMIISDNCDQQCPWDFANYKMVGSDQSSRSTTTTTTIPNNSESATTKPTKQDQQDHDQVKEETPSDDHNDHDNASLDTDDHTSLWPNEFNDLELSDPTIRLLTSTPKVGSDNDHDDVVSQHVMFPFEAHRTAVTATSLDLDTEDFVKSIDFCDSDFQFSEAEFPI